jgi:hypothetical protein
VSDLEAMLAHAEQICEDVALFTRTYCTLGWVNYDRMTVEILSSVVRMNVEDGEVALVNYHLDSRNLEVLGYRFQGNCYQPWRPLYDRAVERASTADYLSAIPLVLSIIDGICTTSTGRHPFSGGADAPVFDCQAAGPGGLADGLALLGATRRKLDTGPISLPFRHGIVHGINPNYGHPIVAAKAFNLLQATVDYFDRRRDESLRVAKAKDEQRAVDVSELCNKLLKSSERKRALETWKPRPRISAAKLSSSDQPTTLQTGSPEAFAAQYLTMLLENNYGALAEATVDTAYPSGSGATICGDRWAGMI